MPVLEVGEMSSADDAKHGDESKKGKKKKKGRGRGRGGGGGGAGSSSSAPEPMVLELAAVLNTLEVRNISHGVLMMMVALR